MHGLFLLGVILMFDSVCCTVTSCGRDFAGHVTIHGGWQVQDQRRWPWMVSFQWKNTGSHFCSGTLVDSNWVVTAAHCVDEIFRENKTEEVKLVFGSLNLNVPESSRVVKNISQIYIHPNYVYNSTNPLYIINDIALVRISGMVNLTNHVQPACLPDPNPVFYRDCHAIGWGRRNMWEPEGGPLKETRVLTFPPSSCARAHPAMSSMINRGNFVCAMGFLGGRICKGDSGGPLLCKIGLDTKWRLVGVASWTTGMCSMNERPFGFAEVKHFLNWVKRKINMVDPCKNSPCKNGGTCASRRDDTGAYTMRCYCGYGRYGDHCEKGMPTQRPRLDLTVTSPGTHYGVVAALPGGEALVVDRRGLWSSDPAKVVRLDRHGRMVPPAFTCRPWYNVNALLLDGEDVYVVQKNIISKIRLSALNQTLAEWQIPRMYTLYPGALEGDELYLLENIQKLAFSFNLKNNNTQIRKTGLYGLKSMDTAIISDTQQFFFVLEVNACRISIFNSAWNLTGTFGGQQLLGYPQQVLVTPWSTLLVADSRNSRVSEFSLSGRFVRHVLTSRDGLVGAWYISYSDPYLWVVHRNIHRNRYGGPPAVRRYQLV